jgi:hypothetical protein
MTATLHSHFRIGGIALALAFAAASGRAADPVRAGFDRMLTTERASAVAPAVPDGPADPLIAALVVPLRDGATVTSASRAADPVVESFARMLTHEPNRATPELPQGAWTDPLIAAVVWPLLRSKHYTVAGAASPARH